MDIYWLFTQRKYSQAARTTVCSSVCSLWLAASWAENQAALKQAAPRQASQWKEPGQNRAAAAAQASRSHPAMPLLCCRQTFHFQYIPKKTIICPRLPFWQWGTDLSLWNFLARLPGSLGPNLLLDQSDHVLDFRGSCVCILTLKLIYSHIIVY